MMGDPGLRGKVLWALVIFMPDELDPDVKSRAPLQIPILDLKVRRSVSASRRCSSAGAQALSAEELPDVFQQTFHYSARDFDKPRSRGQGAGKPVLEVLQIWQASTAIVQQRRHTDAHRCPALLLPATAPRVAAEHARRRHPARGGGAEMGATPLVSTTGAALCFHSHVCHAAHRAV